jgi:geranylgeranyl pyrophosphate synthase
VPLAGEDRVKLQSLQELISADLFALEEEYRRLLSGDLPLLQEICDHLKLGKGKRFRPTLLLIAAKHGDEVDPDAIFAAACVEMVHTATLVHDDFIDEAEMRRQLPTVNARWGASAALIMGDYLYSKVFALLTARNMMDPLKILARTTHLMSIAEMMQLERRRLLDLSEEDYLTIIRRKTASLIEASCEIGSLLHPELASSRASLGRFGLNVGLAFQITDDIFDYLGDRRRLGKPVGGDWREGRITLPFIAAWRNAPERESRDLQEALVAGVEAMELWPDVCRIVENHGGVDYAYDVAARCGRLAKASIRDLSVQPQREVLAAAADYVLGRLN